jgi:hypothetical protein
MDAAPLKADAAIGQLVGFAFDMFQRGNLTPDPDPRLMTAGFVIRGYITALDALLPRLGPLQLGEKTYYGFLAESVQTPGQFVAAIRGTADLVEWGIDGEVSLVPHHCGGLVEMGFNGLYQSMRYRPLGAPDSPLAPGIAKAVGQGSLTVIGHSLGSALASLATLDFTLIHGMGGRVDGLFLASPRVGDAAFADTFAHFVSDARGYARPADIVPKIPAGFGYTPLRCTQLIGRAIAQATIKPGDMCAHHVWTYLSDMDYSLTNWQAFPPLDRDLTACILGPAHP